MNARERFVRVLTGKPVDRVPFMKVFGGQNHVLPQWEQDCPGLSRRIDRFLGFEGRYRGWQTTPVNLDMANVGAWETVEEDTQKRVARRGDGLVKLFMKGDFHHQTLQWPVAGRDDWERVKANHVLTDIDERFPKDWQRYVEELRCRDYPLQLTHRGVYGFARNLMGDVNLAYAFYDAPDLVHDIMHTYTDMAISVWERMCADLDFDLIECWEDMASKHGSIISPATFREFMKPQYEKIADFAKGHGIEVILVDSDGNIMELAGLMREAGVTAMYPFEVQAGNDVGEALARTPGMAALGGLKKEAMAEGPEAVDREMAKAARLIRGGRFIPGPDHFVLSNTTWDQYRDFMQKLREVVVSTPVEYPPFAS